MSDPQAPEPSPPEPSPPATGPTAADVVGPGSAPATLAARSQLEAFLWLLITRLIALLSVGRAAAPPDRDAAGAAARGVDGSASGPGVDPDRARRVAASRAAGGTGDGAPAPAVVVPADHQGADRARTVALTAATAVVGAAAAFALGRRRGAR